MTVTPIRPAEAAAPRLLPLEAWLATSGTDLTHPATEDHLTWLQLVSVDALVGLFADYQQLMAGKVAADLERGTLLPGGFLADERFKSAATRAALVSACSLILAGIAEEAGVTP